MTLLESRVEGLWLARQPSKGTMATLADKLLRKVGGGMNAARSDGSENYSDGTRFGDAMDFVDTLMGDGSPVGQAQPGVVGFAAAMLLGSETVTAAGPNFDHVATPGPGGNWLTAWKKVGAQVGPLRQKFGDCRIVSMRIEGSTANKVVKVTLQLLSLITGEIFTTDPVRVIDPDLPFLHTEGIGRYSIDGQVYSGQSSWAIVITDAATASYGDDVVPFDVGFGVATVTLEAITLSLDAAALARYYTQIYGVAAPVAGMRPLKSLPSPGSYTVDLRKGQSFTVTVTGVPTGGNFTPTVNLTAAAAVAWNATAAIFQTSLEGIVGKGKVTVTGGPSPTTPFQVVFADAGTTLTISSALTGGTTPTATPVDNGHNRGLKIEVPSVHWSPDMSIEGNPDGGVTELPLSGQARTAVGQPTTRITTRSGDSAAY